MWNGNGQPLSSSRRQCRAAVVSMIFNLFPKCSSLSSADSIADHVPCTALTVPILPDWMRIVWIARERGKIKEIMYIKIDFEFH